MDFATVLPRLVSTYESGRLVPFLGVGMSRPACTSWVEMVRTLEKQAKIEKKPLAEDAFSEEIVRRGNSAVRMLKASGAGDFDRAMRAALVAEGGCEPPPQMRALTRLRWPLVLTTNYDNCYAAALENEFSGALQAARKDVSGAACAVVGRSAEDCQRVLNSLSTAGRPLLWALQGYLDAPCTLQHSTAPPELATELVVGHDEYRRVTYRDVHFRRAFAEVFRHRSLLFLGSGIRESYLQELFGEVLEIYGTSTRPHYALMPRGEVEAEFMLARFQIVVVEYDKDQHGEVKICLDQLAEAATSSARAAVGWRWGQLSQGREKLLASECDFEVSLTPLPGAPRPGECLAVSAGGPAGETFYYSDFIERLLVQWGVNPAEKPQPTASRYLGHYPDQRVYAVRARTEKDGRTLKDIYQASFDLFEHANTRYECIRLQVVGAGGVEEPKGSAKLPKRNTREYNRRPFAERFPFIQIVRAWGEWRRRKVTHRCRLVLHLISPSIAADLASGRIDVLELLHCSDVRFAAEVVSAAGTVERRLFQEMPATTLGEIVRKLDLSPEHWKVNVSPAPRLEAEVQAVAKCLNCTLLDLDVIPGSTLHFRHIKAG